VSEAPAEAVLVHPTLASARAMAPLAEALGVAARMPDLPGHGRGEPWPPERTGDYFDACVEALGPLPEGVHLVGHSYGAAVALRAALAASGRVRTVVLVEPVLFWAMDAEGQATHARESAPFSEAIARGETDRAARLFHGLWGAGPWEAMPEAARRTITGRIHLIPLSGGALREDAKGQRSELARSEMPLLYLCRADPPPVTAAIRAGLRRLRPDMEEAEVAGAGHMLPQTHPRETAKAIRDFWAAHPPDRAGG
jgi:pimeloyl-ACP methyl ester carboxylesterase